MASSPLRGSPDTVREREGRAGEGVNIAIKKALEVRAYLRSNAASLKVAGRNQTRSSNGISAATRGGGQWNSLGLFPSVGNDEWATDHRTIILLPKTRSLPFHPETRWVGVCKHQISYRLCLALIMFSPLLPTCMVTAY